jgi:hypothetical protein
MLFQRLLALTIGLFPLCYASAANTTRAWEHDLIIEHIPSAVWPQFITTSRDIVITDESGKEFTLSANTRGVFLRAENNDLLIDFGRNGIQLLNAKSTDFFDRVSALMTGTDTKDFPNLALQIGNKLVTFARGDASGAIRFEEIKPIQVYVLLYLDNYSPDYAQALLDFGLAYKDLKKQFPFIELVLMPRDRKFYDFAFTVGYSVPLITPHVRNAYIDTLKHNALPGPTFVAVDANGRILGRTEKAVEWSKLNKQLEILVNELDLEWRAPRISHRRAYQRTASWLN